MAGEPDRDRYPRPESCVASLRDEIAGISQAYTTTEIQAYLALALQKLARRIDELEERL